MGGKPADCKEPTGVAALTPGSQSFGEQLHGHGARPRQRSDRRQKGRRLLHQQHRHRRVLHQPQRRRSARIGEKVRSNGINLSPDEKTLYVTNGPVIMAYDVQPDGSVKNQREFAKLEGGGNGDGMADRRHGPHLRHRQRHSSVHSRRKISGHDSNAAHGHQRGVLRSRQEDAVRRLYRRAGRERPRDQNADGVRNTAMTIYKIQTLTQGFKGRAK